MVKLIYFQLFSCSVVFIWTWSSIINRQRFNIFINKKTGSTHPFFHTLSGSVPESRAALLRPKLDKVPVQRTKRLDQDCQTKSHSEAADNGMRNQVRDTKACALVFGLYIQFHLRRKSTCGYSLWSICFHPYSTHCKISLSCLPKFQIIKETSYQDAGTTTKNY